jgi:CRP-like cAMP-binding protein
MDRRVLANRLLGKMGAEVVERLGGGAEVVSLRLGEPLIVPHEPISHVYFPVGALASLVTVLEDGTTVEAGSVGREGMVGIPVILGAVATPMQTLTQIAGDAVRVPADVVKAEYGRGGPLHDVLTQYIHTIFIVASQSAACNRRHEVEARLARWLLMSADGIGSEELAITQEFLAAMLGVRRPGVTLAALKLQEQGLIRYSRGLVQILDRPGLEAAACECYHVVRQEFERLLA